MSKQHETVPVASRVKIKSLALLTRAYIEDGVHLRSKSDVLWRAVEQLAAFYSRRDGIPAFGSVREAGDYMESVGMPLGTNERSAGSLLRAEADEALMAEGGELLRPAVLKGRRAVQEFAEKTGFAERSPEQQYEAIAKLMRAQGIEPVSFAEFLRQKEQKDETNDSNSCNSSNSGV